MLVYFKLDSFFIDNFLIDYFVIKKKRRYLMLMLQKSEKKKLEILLDGKLLYDKKIIVSVFLCSVLIRVVYIGRQRVCKFDLIGLQF